MLPKYPMIKHGSLINKLLHGTWDIIEKQTMMPGIPPRRA